LETLSVPIIGFRTSRFPGFYLADSGFDLEYRVDSPKEIASIWSARNNLGITRSGMVVANPVVNQMDPTLHARTLENGMKEATNNSITGKAVTPFLLDYFHRNTGGESLRVNIDIIKANAALAADIAVALNQK
jgi:pseudouridine-5'-phosphate glycosidase